MDDSVVNEGTLAFAQSSDESHKSDFAFRVLVLLSLVLNLKPEFLIPGLSDNAIARSVPNILSFIIIAAWIVGHKKLWHNPQTRYYIAFYVLMVVGMMTARNYGRAFPIVKAFAINVAMYLATISIVDEMKKLKKLIRIFLLCNIFLAIIGIVSGGQIKSIPVLSDENDFSLMMNILIPFAFFRAYSATEHRVKIFYYCVTLLFAAGVVVSFSRGGFVGFLCTATYCFMQIKRKGRIIVAVLIIGVISLFFIPQSYINEVKTLEQGTEESTAAERIYFWTIATKIYLDHPILGVGPGNAGVWIPDYDITNQGNREWGRALHSLYFTLLSELGSIGVLLFVGMLISGEQYKRSVRAMYYKIRVAVGSIAEDDATIRKYVVHTEDAYYLALSLTGALIGFLTSGAFLSVLYYGWFWMIMMYTVILFNVTRPLDAEVSDQIRRLNTAPRGY